ncbi:MAG TPA: tRNA threonylcarbamoyladenosine dehydratase [Burkholderiaceae bacterium]|nr:tRNA threonylcarbamoyladenosine dehydratase [Burkholderiaceae bacterium]
MEDNNFVDAERRFGGLDRLYGAGAANRLAQGHVVVAGIGGVGSWCAEALARCGVGRITLIDLDHVAESNINRQIHALGSTLGQSKVVAMMQRIKDINPACDVICVDDFVAPENVRDIVPAHADMVLDCTDQAAAKVALILEARQRSQALLVCGGAGGKTNPLALRSGDLSQAVNDALLSRLRNTLRRQHGFPRGGEPGGKVRKRVPRMGVRVLWFDQPAILPEAWTQARAESEATSAPQGLSCAGYGSAVMVTASMGLSAADEAVHWLLHGKHRALPT